MLPRLGGTTRLASLFVRVGPALAKRHFQSEGAGRTYGAIGSAFIRLE